MHIGNSSVTSQLQCEVIVIVTVKPEIPIRIKLYFFLPYTMDSQLDQALPPAIQARITVHNKILLNRQLYKQELQCTTGSRLTSSNTGNKINVFLSMYSTTIHIKILDSTNTPQNNKNTIKEPFNHNLCSTNTCAFIIYITCLLSYPITCGR